MKGYKYLYGIRILDGDGYGNPLISRQSCYKPFRWVAQAGDCNDLDASIPGPLEICGNLLDENCDGQIGEGCPGNPFIVIIGAIVYESQGIAKVTVNLSKKSTKVIKVNFKTVNGTATSPADYTAKTGTLSIPAGAQTGTFTVDIKTDNITEPIESFTVVLSSPVNATISVGTGTVAIRDGAAPQGALGIVPSVPAKVIKPVEVEQKLSIKAMPNPTTHQFTLVTQSSSSQPISIRVIDNVGRLVEFKNNIASNGTYTIGQNYRPGMYYVEVSQGKLKTTVKLVKQAN